MTASQARSITTNQVDVHPDLIQALAKHQSSDFKRPIAAHTTQAFTNLLDWLGDWQGEVIVDAGCGVGESSKNISEEYPDAKVVGVDKSLARLDKHKSYAGQSNEETLVNEKTEPSHTAKNYLLLQADLNDFWRLLAQYIEENKPSWKIARQFILYPNPYPKKTQLGKRWHGSALFPFIVKVSPNIEVRSNWRLYLDECLIAAQHYGLTGSIEAIVNGQDNKPYTPFERKYLDSDQTCFKLVIRP
ncbi:MAG: tRNA G46 methylase TrmB [Alphaproteobacteria bacterium]|jgi:tRNA G46 methylase TrmB